MADLNEFPVTEEDNPEIRAFKETLANDPDNFETWEKLVHCCEMLDGGLNRNSNPNSIATFRSTMDMFLRKFPLLFGYWKKYADMEFNISGTESAEMVYERGCASVCKSVDLWTGYCSFKMETTHNPTYVRELFERGAESIGLDFLSHPFWDKYIEYEERQEAPERVFAILKKVISIPVHQYARYYERFRTLAATRPIAELVDEATISSLRTDVQNESATFGIIKTEPEVERDIRNKIDALYYETFVRTQTETTRRWAFESELKRPYFHVTELNHKELANWRQYLDFEESEGDRKRITFLYERCLTTAAFYDEIWFRYTRWLSSFPDANEEDIRSVYRRAAMYFVPISRPAIRLQWAYFEEACGYVDVAREIHNSILSVLPDCVEAILSLASLEMRQRGLEAAVAVYTSHIESASTDVFTKAAIMTEWADALWRSTASAEAPRTLFTNFAATYQDSRQFWQKWLEFELKVPLKSGEEESQQARVLQVFADMRTKSRLSIQVKKELGYICLEYLQRRGTASAMKAYMKLDRELFGPLSVSSSKPNGVATELDDATRLRAESNYYSFCGYFGQAEATAQGMASYS